MGMEKIGLLGVLGVLLAVQFKGGKTEYGIYISIGISIIICLCIADKLKEIMHLMKRLEAMVNVKFSYAGTLVRMLGITYIAEFASSICKDAGYQTIALQIEIFCKLTLLVMSLPILLALLQTVQGFLL